MTRRAHIAISHAIFAAILLAVLSGAAAAQTIAQEVNDIAYSDFLGEVNKGEVRDVTIRGATITGDLKNGQPFETYAPNDTTLIARLVARHVEVDAIAPDTAGSLLLRTAIDWLPLLLIIGAILWLKGKPGTGAGPQTDVGKSRARLVDGSERRLTFDDVAGVDEAREGLAEIVEFLRSPARFTSLGGRVPKGCLLIGPPGTGKTLLARATAGEAGVPFFTVAGSDFVEMYVGVGASRVRDMFAKAKTMAPSIIFIDEIDALGRRRGIGQGSDEREQTLNQLLVEMDGFENRDRVIVMAATNRADVLDPALLRPGRFDRQVFVPNPDLGGRQQILKVHLRKVPTAADVDVSAIARTTPGLSGADLANLVNEAALRAAHADKESVSTEELEAARERVLLGPERRSVSLTEDERRRIAYHEGGHALVAIYVPGNDPLAKVTIVPHGRSLGATLSLPEHDRRMLSKRQMEARIAMHFGGRVAEELVLGRDGITNAAADDIEKASLLARRMVREFGFSDELGVARYLDDAGNLMNDSAYPHCTTVSKSTANLIDGEVRRFVRQGEELARSVLASHMGELHGLAAALLRRETLSGADIAQLVASWPSDQTGGLSEAAFSDRSIGKEAVR